MNDTTLPGVPYIPLPQGNGGSTRWRSAAGVHRAVGPWTPMVHAFLRHLSDNGYTGAPRVIGFDRANREVLSYIDGVVLANASWQPGRPTPWPEWAQAETCLVETAGLLRELHVLATSFEPSKLLRAASPQLHIGEQDILCHGDLGPHNTVYRDGRPVAFIDWDSVRAAPALLEFGQAAWHFVPLADDDYFSESSFTETPDLASRLAAFAGGYGVTDRATVASALQQAKQRSLERITHWQVSARHAAVLFRLVARDLEWLHDNSPRILSKLRD